MDHHIQDVEGDFRADEGPEEVRKSPSKFVRNGEKAGRTNQQKSTRGTSQSAQTQDQDDNWKKFSHGIRRSKVLKRCVNKYCFIVEEAVVEGVPGSQPIEVSLKDDKVEREPASEADA